MKILYYQIKVLTLLYNNNFNILIMGYKYNLEKNQVEQIVKESINFSEVLVALGIPRQGNNGKTLRNFLDNNNIDYSHFTGRAREYKKSNSIKIEDYLNNKNKIQSSKLRTKLIKEGLKENKCEICSISEWQGQPLVIQLHHINGNHYDNSLENLQMLCPNCHSQTENYANSQKEKKHYYCPNCGKEIRKGSKYCVMCSNKKSKQIQPPSLEQLILDFKELKSFKAIGIKYNVSDKTASNWFKRYDLPYKSKELKEYIKNI